MEFAISAATPSAAVVATIGAVAVVQTGDQRLYRLYGKPGERQSVVTLEIDDREDTHAKILPLLASLLSNLRIRAINIRGTK